MNKVQLAARYIKHLAESDHWKGSSTLNQGYIGLIGNRILMPNVHLPIRFPERRIPLSTSFLFFSRFFGMFACILLNNTKEIL